jgi:hypothetical protein
LCGVSAERTGKSVEEIKYIFVAEEAKGKEKSRIFIRLEKILC